MSSTLHPRIQELLRQRGVEEPDWSSFTFPKLADIADPFLMKGMNEAVLKIKQAYLNEDPICIYADFDLDGTSGLALLYEGFSALGFKKLIKYQPRRLGLGYGFHSEVVDELKTDGVQLIITVDVGITAHKAVQRAREQSIDVIITDHHQPEAILPEAFAIINPNQQGCCSNLGYLSGAGVAFYLLRAVRRVLNEHLNETQRAWDLKSVLDFFAIATITDMVPLVGDNRVLVKHGLMQLSKSNHFGLNALLKKLDLSGKQITSNDLGMKFAPKLNALSRLDSDLKPIDIFLEKDLAQSMNLATEVLRQNEKRVLLQMEAEAEAQRLLQDWKYSDFVFLFSEKFHRGVIGLIANKLMQQLRVPVFVASLELKDQILIGSGRAPDHQPVLLEMLEKASSVLTRFGGHQAAAGFELNSSQILEFIETLAHYSFKNSGKTIAQHKSCDLIMDIDELDFHFMHSLYHLEPFGMSFPFPLIKFQQTQIESIKTLKEVHSKFLFSSSITPIEGIYFGGSSKIKELNVNEGDHVDVIGEPQWNYFKGKRNLQVVVQDVVKSPQTDGKNIQNEMK